MSDPQGTAPTPPPVVTTPPGTTSRGVKIALALSVALNLAVAGLAVGAWLGGGGHQSILLIIRDGEAYDLSGQKWSRCA